MANFGKLSPEQKRELMLEMKEQQLEKDMRMRGRWNKRQLNELAGEHMRIRKILKKPLF